MEEFELDKLTEIGKEIANKLGVLPEIKAIAIYGGIAEGYADRYSDIDLICYCTKAPSIQKRKQVLGITKIKQLTGHPDTDVIQYKNTTPNIFYCEFIPLIKEWVKDALRNGKLYNPFLISHVLNTKSLYDPDKLLAGWKAKLKPILKKHIIWAKRNSISKLEHEFFQIDIAIKRENLICINQKIAKVIDLFLTALYALNEQPFMSSNWASKRIKDFKIKPKNCVKRLKAILKMGNSPKDLEKKLILLKKLTKDLNFLVKKRI